MEFRVLLFLLLLSWTALAWPSGVEGEEVGSAGTILTESEIENSQDSFPEYSTPFWGTTDIPEINIDSECKLDDERGVYTCSSYNLKEVPTPLPDNLDYLLLQNTGISQIGDDAFGGSSIGHLTLKQNRDLKKISRNAFRNITGLQYLYIRGHNIDSWEFTDNFFDLFGVSEELVNLLLENNNITFTASAAWSRTPILSSLEYLSLKSNPLRVLSKDLFSPLRFSPVRELNLQNCSLVTIEKGVFLHLPFLEHVDFHYNADLFTPSGTPDFQNALASMPLTLNNLGLGHNYLSIIPTESLAEVQTSLWRLNLAENYFPTLGSLKGNGTFPLMGGLRILVLDSCSINTLHEQTFNNLVSLEMLSLMNNPLVEFSVALLLPSLSSLTLQMNSLVDNKYFQFPAGLFKLRDMSRLKELRLESAQLRDLSPAHLEGLHNLEILSLANSKILNYSGPAFEGLTNLKNLSLAFCETEVPLTWASLQGPRLLKILDLTGSTFCLDSVYTDAWKSPRSNVQLEILNLTKVLARSWEEHSLDFLADFQFLQVLEIGGNKIRSWNTTLLKNMKTISVFKMDYNGIDILLTAPMISDFFNSSSLTLLDLSHNMFICNSQISRFYREVANHPDLVVEGYGNGYDYFCMDPSDQQPKTFHEYSTYGPGLEEGLVDGGITVYQEPGLWQPLLAVGLALSVMVVIFGLAYRHRWYIRFFYISHLKAPVLRQEPFIYDAFVSYSQEQESWVQNKLVPFLEQTKPALKLCLHHRDFQVGKSITENIVDCMDSSRKFLVILTKSYLLSSWCMFEVHLAQHRLIQENRASLIVVKLGNLPDKTVPKSVKYLLSSTTYLQMNQEDPCLSLITRPADVWQGTAAWRKLKVTLLEEQDKYAAEEE